MNFFVKKENINFDNLNINDIIYNDTDDWKIDVDMRLLENNIFFSSERYQDVSLFPVYDVINSKGLILLVSNDISNSEYRLIKNNELYDIITSINQKLKCFSYAILAKPLENGSYLLLNYYNEKFNFFKSKYHYVILEKNNRVISMDDKLDKDFAHFLMNHKVTQKDGVLYYYGSPWYVHYYLSNTDNEYFKLFEKNIKCDDLQIIKTSSRFNRFNDVRFYVKFDTERQALDFLDGFYARKLINCI